MYQADAKYHVDAIRIDFRHPGPRKEKLYSHDEYMELLLGDKIKSFLVGTLLYRKYYTERFRDGELVEDYAYHPHLMDLVPEILVVSDESLYHYTENRPGSTTYLTGIRAAGISARLANAENGTGNTMGGIRKPAKSYLGRWLTTR